MVKRLDLLLSALTTTTVTTITKKSTHRETLEARGMFITLTVVMTSWVYAYAQIHQIVYIKYMLLYVCVSHTHFFKTQKLWTKPPSVTQTWASGLWDIWEQVSKIQLPGDKVGTLSPGSWCHNGIEDHPDFDLNSKALALRNQKLGGLSRILWAWLVERGLLHLRSGNMALVLTLPPRNPTQAWWAHGISWGLRSTPRT